MQHARELVRRPPENRSPPRGAPGRTAYALPNARDSALVHASLDFVRVHPATPAQWLLLTRLDTSPLAKQVTQLTKRCIDHPVCKAGHHPVGEATAVFE